MKKGSKSLLFLSYFGLLIGISFLAQFFNLFIEKEEINATITKSYYTHSSSAGSSGWSYNIERIDLNGELQEDGNLKLSGQKSINKP